MSIDTTLVLLRGRKRREEKRREEERGGERGEGGKERGRKWKIEEEREWNGKENDEKKR